MPFPGRIAIQASHFLEPVAVDVDERHVRDAGLGEMNRVIMSEERRGEQDEARLATGEEVGADRDASPSRRVRARDTTRESREPPIDASRPEPESFFEVAEAVRRVRNRE